MLNVFMLAYNEIKMIDGALRNFETTTTQEEKKLPRYLVYCDFPNQSRDDLKTLSREFNWTFLRLPKNYGVAGNWSLVWQILGLDSQDCLFGMDPDARPQQLGYLTAIDYGFKYATDAAYICLNQPGLKQARPDMVTRSFGPVRLNHSPTLYSWSVGAFHGRFIERIWPLRQPRQHYGWIEHWCYAQMQKLGLEPYTLADYYDHHIDGGGPLRAWKTAQAQGHTALDYGDWCRQEAVSKTTE